MGWLPAAVVGGMTILLPWRDLEFTGVLPVLPFVGLGMLVLAEGVRFWHRIAATPARRPL